MQSERKLKFDTPKWEVLNVGGYLQKWPKFRGYQALVFSLLDVSKFDSLLGVSKFGFLSLCSFPTEKCQFYPWLQNYNIHPTQNDVVLDWVSVVILESVRDKIIGRCSLRLPSVRAQYLADINKFATNDNDNMPNIYIYFRGIEDYVIDPDLMPPF